MKQIIYTKDYILPAGLYSIREATELTQVPYCHIRKYAKDYNLGSIQPDKRTGKQMLKLNETELKKIVIDYENLSNVVEGTELIEFKRLYDIISDKPTVIRIVNSNMVLQPHYFHGRRVLLPWEYEDFVTKYGNKYTWQGKEYNLLQLARIAHIKGPVLQKRLAAGLPLEVAMLKNVVFFDDKYWNVEQIAELTGRDPLMIKQLIKDPSNLWKAFEPLGNVDVEKEELYDYKGRLYNVFQLARMAHCTGYEMTKRLEKYKNIEECLK